MSIQIPEPLIGQIVEITKGREAGQFAIIIQALNERFVLLADGNKRKFDQPKKKNLFHIRFTGDFAAEVFASIAESGRVTNSKLRYCLNRFIIQQNPDHASVKEEYTNGER